ncbi:MAG: hypothetical protein IPJ84_20955 [Bdellovibrionales bacterium]|nr:hypothetical protein [Bdellovibrionales bacterium]
MIPSAEKPAPSFAAGLAAARPRRISALDIVLKSPDFSAGEFEALVDEFVQLALESKSTALKSIRIVFPLQIAVILLFGAEVPELN